MREPFVVEQTAERLEPDTSLPDVLMAVEFRTARGFSVVAMPEVDILEADGAVKSVKRFGVSGVTNNVISGDVGMTGIDAGSARHEVAQEVQQLGDLFEVGAERELRSGGVLDQNAQLSGFEVKALGPLLDGECDAPQAFFAAGAAELSRMKDEIVSPKCQGAFDLAAKARNGLRMEFGIASRQVHQIVRMDGQRLQAVPDAQPNHFRNVSSC